MNRMSTLFQVFCFHIAFLTLALLPSTGAAQSLQVTYGNKGIQTLSYNGVTLENVGSYPADLFHIFHMKSTDLNGNLVAAGAYGWGETNTSESWNASTNTETYTFPWGSISTQFVQSGSNLNMIVTETNHAGSGIIFDGAELYPLALHFPQDPVGFNGYNQYVITTMDPGVSAADFGYGVVTSVLPNESIAMYGGWRGAGTNTYTPFMTTTAPDGLATFLPSNDYPVQPGSSLTYTVSLRFTPEGVAANAADAYASFAATYPSQLHWTDKRIIGTAYLASSPSESNITLPGGYPTNPRRYFNDPTVDITTAAGLQAFQDHMIATAVSNVTNALLMNSQGVVTWDIEGEQYAQSTSYVCSPDEIATIAPEMETTITNRTSPYFGQKLDDAYFRIMANAGLRTGVCLRPQMFTLAGNGTASQIFLTTNAAVIANLENKARYANSRWGTTLFYVDSSVNPLGGTLDPAIFQQLITDFPSFLFIPEESTTRYYAYSAPFSSFIFHTTVGTQAATYLTYPNAFGATLVNDVSPATLAAYTPQLISAVSKGDILMGIADFWQANDPTLIAIYAAAGGAKPSPVQTTPSVLWTTPAAISYGTALSGTQLNASANVAGTFTYTPSAGTVLSAGTPTLMTTFTPADTTDYKSTTATVNLQVNQVTPAVSWATPAAISVGTALSSTQLNATANVPGSFSYSPAAGFVPGVGTTTLQVTFTPADAVDYASVTSTVTLTVTSSSQTTPVITWNSPAAIVYGTALTSTQLNATANVSGSFSYNPSAGTVLGAGTTILQVTFAPRSSHYTSVTATTSVQVTPYTPVINWATPAPITSGTALSSAQLNATANVAGNFIYSPGPGTMPSVGTTTLQATFTPYDTTDYSTQTVTVQLVVTATKASTNVVILYPSAGATISGTINVLGYVNLFLDSAGTYLMVDGVDVSTYRVMGSPWLYKLDTTTLSNGSHTLQLWGHDIGNNVTLSAPVTVNVAN